MSSWSDNTSSGFTALIPSLNLGTGMLTSDCLCCVCVCVCVCVCDSPAHTHSHHSIRDAHNKVSRISEGNT
jgi:hypothetical protein